MALEPPSNSKRERYQHFLELGFSKEWVDELTLRHPSLYNKPKSKIEGLRQRGFDNPVKLVTRVADLEAEVFGKTRA